MGFTYNVLSSMIVPLVVVLAIADDVHIIQHYEEAPADGIGGGRVQGDRLASGRAAVRRQRDDGARDAVAGDEQRRRRPRVRHGRGDRRDGRLRRSRSSCVPTMLGWLKPETRAPPQETWFKTADRSPSRAFSTRRPRLIWQSPWSLTALAASGCRACASTPTTSTSSAARTRSRVGRGHRHEARRHLHVPDSARRAGRVAAAARRAQADGSLEAGAPQAAVRPQGNRARRLRETHPSRPRRTRRRRYPE